MKSELKLGSVNQIIAGTSIFEAGDPISGIGLIVKGRVKIFGKGVVFTVGTGNFLGIFDLTVGKHRVTYQAETDCAVYVFPAKGKPSDLSAIIKANKEYGSLLISTMSKVVRTLFGTMEEFETETEEIYGFLKEGYKEYQDIGSRLHVQTMEISSLEKLAPFFTKNGSNEEKIRYYIDCCKIPSDIQKAYYGSSVTIGSYHVMELIDLINQMMASCQEYVNYLKESASILVKDNRSLYMSVIQLANMMKSMEQQDEGLHDLLDHVIDRINRMEKILLEKSGNDLEIDREFMEEAYFELMSAGASSVENEPFALVEEMESEADVSELSDSLTKILEYGEEEEASSEALKQYVEQFANLSDKFSSSDEARKIRKEIGKIYYELYGRVFRKAYRDEEDVPLAVDLFLRFGLLSEKLLKESLLEELVTFKPGKIDQGECQVYDMKEWLTAIYEGKKEPSKSEFDMDYEEYLRDLKKTGQITTEQLNEMGKDREKKLDYEISNMFRTNHRLIQGQVSTFVPFLFTEGCSGTLHKAILTKERISASVRRILMIDFSVFYRESLYVNLEKGIQKEYIQEQVFPDIILFPAYGSHGVMWQELSGRKRNTRGRFLMPQFLEGDLDAIMIKLFGRFRWELCRTIQGASWNNIQYKSLTSEYSDFVQFYRKNRDLSEDRKEKLKLQIQKSRNNTREVFVQDYENWIKHEAKGGLCLSKPVREIMATYCPFAKAFREKVAEQPLFQEAMARYIRETGKKMKEYDLKFKVWTKDAVEVPKEICETRDFYLVK